VSAIERRRGPTLRIADRPGHVRRLRAPGAALSEHAFSPRGDRLAYLRLPGARSATRRLVILDLAGGQRYSLRIWGRTPRDVAWAPADERLALAREASIGLTDSAAAWGPDLPVARSETGEEEIRQVTWSPRGDALAFVLTYGDFFHEAIGVLPVPPAPGPPRLVVPRRRANFSGLSWSPDGSRLAYSAFSGL
jgi:dipeptidyl aminopeptidase/acylaminoacyl peptidase